MRQYLLLVCLAVAFGLWPATTQAATKYWIGSSGGTFGTNSNWSTTSGSSCGSNANTTAPGTSDTAVFGSDCTTDPTVSAAISVGGLTVGSGHTVDIASNNLTVSGTFSNDGTLKLNGSETISVTMDTDSGTVEYTSNAPSGFAAGNNYYNLTFTKATGIWEQGAALDVNGALTITSGAYDTNSNAITLAGNFSNSGTFDAGTGTVTLDGTDQTIAGSTNTTFYNLTKQETSNDSTDAVLTIAASSTQTVSNTFNLDGLDSNDKLKIRSSTTGTKHTWTVSSAQTANYLDVKDSQTSTSDITCSNCTNSGNNDNAEASPHWVFSSSVSLSGTVYSDEGSTPLTSKTVRYAVNGTDIDTTTSNASTGAYSFSGVTASAGDVITVYLEDESQDAVTVTVSAGAALSGINLFQDRLLVRQDNSGSLTNSNLSTAAVSSESDISNIYSVSSGALTVASGKELFIVSSHTFAPGGTITVDDIDINGTLTLGSNAATVSGTWDATGGAFTSSGTVTFTSTSTETITSNSNSFSAITFNGSGGTWTLGDALDADGNLTITAGTLDASASNYGIAVGGNWSNSGSFTARSGTVTFDKSSSTQTLTSGGTGSTKQFYKLTHSGAGTLQLATDALQVNNTLINSAGTFDANALAVTATGLATVSGGTYTASTATQTFDGGLTVSGGTFTGSSGTVDVNGTLTVSSGTLTAPTGTFTISGNFAHTGGTFTHNSGTVTLDGTDQTISGSTTFYKFTKSVTSADTLTFTASTTQTISNTLTLNGASGQVLSLRSSSSGTQWSVDPQGTRTVSYLDVKDSNNTNTTAVSCSTGCTNSGNNTNWTFGSSGSGSNTAPTATGPGNIKQATDGSGYVTFETTLADVNSDVTRLKVEYSRDGSDWKDPSLLSADSSSGVSLDDTATYQITSIDTDGGSVKVTIVWKSKSQLSDVYDDTVYLRVTPNDNTTDGSAAVSATFAVDNQAPTVTTLKLLGRTSSSLTLGWTPGATDVNFKQYVLCYSTNASDAQNCKGTAKTWDETKDTKLATQTTNQTTITSLTDQKVYYVLVKAVDTLGNSSVYSQSVFNSFVVTGKPLPPTLSFTTVADTFLTSSWKDGMSPTFTQAGVCYGRDRNRVNQASCRLSGNPNVSVLTITIPSPQNFQLSDLLPSTLYYIKMVIYDSKYGTFLSSLYNQTTCPVGKSRTGSGSCMFITAPPPLPVLTFSNITDSQIEGNWDQGVSSTFVSALICYGRSYNGIRGINCVPVGSPNDPTGVATKPLTTVLPKAFSLAGLRDGTYYYMRVFVTDSVYGTLQSPLYNIRTCEVGKSRPTDGAACRVVTVPTPSPSPSSLPSPSPTPSPEPTDEPPPIVIIENIIDKIIDIPPNIIAFIKEPITSLRTAIPKARAALKPFATNPRTQVVNKVLVTTAAVSVVSSAAAFTSVPGTLGQLPQAISRLWQGLLGLLGLKSKKRPWGRVVDATTGQGVAGAYVQVFDHQSHRLLSTVTSNDKGEFSSLVPPGRYEFRVTKTGWTVTPSAPLLKLVAGEHIYDGQPVTVTEEKLLALVIALRLLDSVPFGKYLMWRVAGQWIEVFLARLSWPLLALGVGLNSLILFAEPNRLASSIEVFYVLLISVKLYLRFRQHPTLGVVTDGVTRQALELAVVRLYQAATGTLVETRVTSSRGQFIFLPSPGVYTVSVTCDGYEAYRESHVIISSKREPVALAFELTPLPPQPLSVATVTP